MQLSIGNDFLSTLYENLQSSSNMVTVAWLRSPILGSEDWSIDRIKFSFTSTTLSSLIVTVNEVRVLPAGNVTLYGPVL